MRHYRLAGNIQRTWGGAEAKADNDGYRKTV